MIMKMTAHKAKPNKIMHYANDKTKWNDTFNMSSMYNDKLEKKIREFNKFAKDDSLKSRKYYHIILSPEPNEQDNNPEKLLNFARELLEEKFPDSMATISIHNDKKNRLDCHIVLSAWKLDGTKINLNNGDYDKIKTYAQDTLAKKHNYKPITKEQRKYNHKRLTQAEEGLKKRGIETQTDYIKRTIKEVLKDDRIIDENSYIKVLKEYNITLTTYKTKDNEIRMSYKTPDIKYGMSELKLGKQYHIENIRNIIIKKIELQNNIKQDVIDIKKDVMNNSDKTQAIKELKETIKKYGAKIPEKQTIKIYNTLQNTKLTAKDIKGIINMIKSYIQAQENELKNNYTRE